MMLLDIVLTVSESKRLIAKAVAAMPAVSHSLANGTIAVPTGSTNSYVVEELTGEKIDKTTFMSGSTLPANVSPAGLLSRNLPDLVLVRGMRVNTTAVDALNDMQAGDIFIKGANALHYETRSVGILIGHPTGGTIGAAIGTIVARRITWVAPVGLEKNIATTPDEVAEFMNDAETDCSVASLWPLKPSELVTEIEALRILAGVDSMQSAAGGLAGAEGATRLVARGTPDQIAAVKHLLDSIHGEPPFVRR